MSQKNYCNAPDYQGNGQELSGIHRDNPAYTLIFIAVGWNGEHFSFLNALHNRMDFRKERWAPVRAHLKPYTFHAIKCKAFNTTTGSRQDFLPAEHIAEFGGITEARLFNSWYLEQYLRWVEFADAELATAETLRFIDKIRDFAIHRQAFSSAMTEVAAEHFQDEEFLKKLSFALECANSAEPDWTTIVDAGFVAEYYTDLETSLSD